MKNLFRGWGLQALILSLCLSVGLPVYAQNQPSPAAVTTGGLVTAVPSAIFVAPAGGAAGKGVVVAADAPLPVTCITGCSGGGSATPYAPADASGSVTTGGTFQQVFAANSSRVNCFIQNPTSATEPLFVHFTTASPATTNSASLGPGASFTCSAGNSVATGAVQVTAATTAHVFIATGS